MRRFGIFLSSSSRKCLPKANLDRRLTGANTWPSLVREQAMSANSRCCKRLAYLQNQRMSGTWACWPVHIGAARSKEFEYIKEIIWRRIQGWTEKLLSKVGKEVLIKAVAQAIPTYAMSCFDLTESLYEEITPMICRYWWNQQDGQHKCHSIG